MTNQTEHDDKAMPAKVMERLRKELADESRTFKDAAGRDWTMALSIGGFMKVKAAHGVDLFALDQGSPPLIEVLYSDPILLARIIFTLVGDQIEDVDEMGFCDAMGEDALWDADRVFRAALIGFFQTARRGDLAETVIATSALIEIGALTGEEELKAVSLAKMVEPLRDMIREKFGKLSGTVPE
jgi:hypothetical protein